MIKNINRAYAAGYIDGDGCFSLQKEIIKTRMSAKFNAGLIISSTNKEVLDWFKETFGGTVRLVKRNKMPFGHKLVYHYRLGKIKGAEFTSQIWPYLVEKKEEASIFINFATSSSVSEKESLIERIKIQKNFTNLVCKLLKEQFELEKLTIRPSEIDFAYLAGFIDAECCLGIQKYKSNYTGNYHHKIQLTCNNTKFPVFK